MVEHREMYSDTNRKSTYYIGVVQNNLSTIGQGSGVRSC